MKQNCPICKKEIESKFSDKEKLHYFHCSVCKIGGKGATVEIAKKEFLKNKVAGNPPPKTEIVTLPKNKNSLLEWSIKNMDLLINESAQFIEKPATERMIKKNTKYVMNIDLKDCWKTPEGQESIVEALQESFEIGATLPEMGSIVPFGKTAEFIPAISAYVFALTSGKNPPFSDIVIECIYENDIFEMSKKAGQFHFEFKKIGFPRGEIVGVVVQATEKKSGNIIGDAYDEKRLMEKAERHSKSYQYYLKDKAALNKAKAEGKDFIQKTPTWKLYESDIHNPYDGADKPEMLKKVAGKSFFAGAMKVRNAMAMEAEWNETGATPEQSHKKTVDKVLEKAIEQVDIEIESEPKPDIKDAEFENVNQEKEDTPTEKKTLFDNAE